MSKLDQLPFFTVKVDGGSGCLFQPTDSAYSYVLTARHVINGNNALTITRQILSPNNDKINENLEIIGTPFIHSDENKDAAIIKVKPVNGIEDLMREDNPAHGNYYLCGHPAARVNVNDYSFRENKLTIENTKPFGYIEAELSRSAIHSEVIGQSGGGIVKIEDACYLLAGIQKKMAAPDAQEALGRIEFMPLSFFDEIVAQNPDELSPLFPPYIASFNRLINDIFPLPNLIIKEGLIKEELKVIAGRLCADFSPETILNIYGNNFLIHGVDKPIINHKRLWICFLELLTINQLHTEHPLTLAQLKELHKKNKLFILDTDKWTKKLEDIYKTDLSDIEKGGAIVICATNETEPTKAELTKAEIDLLVPNIAVPLGQMNISNTVQNPFQELRIVHVFKFQQHIINNAVAFAELTAMNSFQILKNETKGLI